MRGKQAPKRDIRPDPKYGSVIVAKLINYIMEGGRKTVSQKIVYGAFDMVAQRTSKPPLDIFDNAMRNLQPAVEVKSKRVGGANYQVPIPVRGERRLALAFRWMIAAAAARKGRPMADKLADEIVAASNNEGDAIKKKNDVIRMAEANRAFAHFAR